MVPTHRMMKILGAVLALCMALAPFGLTQQPELTTAAPALLLVVVLGCSLLCSTRSRAPAKSTSKPPKPVECAITRVQGKYQYYLSQQQQDQPAYMEGLAKVLQTRPDWEEATGDTLQIVRLILNNPEHHHVRCPVAFSNAQRVSQISLSFQGCAQLLDKGFLARRMCADAHHLVPQSFLISEGSWRGLHPSSKHSSCLWFLKRVGERGGTTLHESADACLRAAQGEGGDQYVAQAHVPRPWLLGGCKAHLTVFVLIVAGERPKALLYKDGFFRCCPKPWDSRTAAPELQLSHLRRASMVRNQRVFSEFEHYEECLPRVAEVISCALCAAAFDLELCCSSRSFVLLQASLVLGEVHGRPQPYLLGFSDWVDMAPRSHSGAVVHRVLEPVLQGVVNYGIVPWTAGEQPAEDPLWEPLITSPAELGEHRMRHQAEMAARATDSAQRTAQLQQAHEQLQASVGRLNAGHKETVQKLQADLGELRARASEARFQNEKLQQRVDELSAKVGALQRECDGAEEHCEREKGKIHRQAVLAAELAKLESSRQLEQANASVAAEKQRVAGLEGELAALQARRRGVDASMQTNAHDLDDVGKLAQREQAWVLSETVTTAILHHASRHAVTECSEDGWLLYGARAINCYMAHPGLELQTRDFDFKVLASSAESFSQQCQACVAAMPQHVREECELQPGATGSFLHLAIHGNRVADFTWLPVSDFQSCCVLHGAPPRVGAWPARSDITGLVGCAVMPAAQLEALLVDDPALPGWRRTKNKAQLACVRLAQQLGLWCCETDVEIARVLERGGAPSEDKQF